MRFTLDQNDYKKWQLRLVVDSPAAGRTKRFASSSSGMVFLVAAADAVRGAIGDRRRGMQPSNASSSLTIIKTFKNEHLLTVSVKDSKAHNFTLLDASE